MLVCENCGSTDVDAQGWVNINTLEFQNWCEDDTNFCNSCEDFVKVRYINQEQLQNLMFKLIGDEGELDCE